MNNKNNLEKNIETIITNRGVTYYIDYDKKKVTAVVKNCRENLWKNIDKSTILNPADSWESIINPSCISKNVLKSYTGRAFCEPDKNFDVELYKSIAVRNALTKMYKAYTNVFNKLKDKQGGIMDELLRMSEASSYEFNRHADKLAEDIRKAYHNE